MCLLLVLTIAVDGQVLERLQADLVRLVLIKETAGDAEQIVAN